MGRVIKEFEEEQKVQIKEPNVKAMAYAFSIVCSLIYLAYSLLTLRAPGTQINLPYAKETNYFIVRYTEQDIKNIDEMLAELDSGYIKILDDLQMEHKNKILVHVYGSKKDFDKALNVQGNNMKGATAVFTAGKLHIISPSAADIRFNLKTFKAAAAHELTRFMIPNILNSESIGWLSECIAMYEVGQFKALKDVDYMVAGDYPTIQELREARTDDIYDIGYTITEFIIEKWGKEQLVELIAFNGDIRDVLGISEQDFEKAWYQYVAEKYLSK